MGIDEQAKILAETIIKETVMHSDNVDVTTENNEIIRVRLYRDANKSYTYDGRNSCTRTTTKVLIAELAVKDNRVDLLYCDSSLRSLHPAVTIQKDVVQITYALLYKQYVNTPPRETL